MNRHKAHATRDQKKRKKYMPTRFKKEKMNGTVGVTSRLDVSTRADFNDNGNNTTDKITTMPKPSPTTPPPTPPAPLLGTRDNLLIRLYSVSNNIASTSIYFRLRRKDTNSNLIIINTIETQAKTSKRKNKNKPRQRD